MNVEEGSNIIYLTTSTKAGLLASVATQWPDVGKYSAAGKLYIRSAYHLFPVGVGKGTRTSTREPRNSAADTTVVICPGALTEYLRTSPPAADPVSASAVSQTDRIIDLEASVDKQFPDCSVVCCVFDELVRRFAAVPLLKFVRHHDFVIRDAHRINALSEPILLDAVKRGIDAAMGNGSSLLILKTLYYVYKLDEHAILQEPGLLSDRLRKVCGDYSNQIMEAIAEEIRKLLLERRQD